MQTITIQVTNDAVLKLIKELESNKLLTIVEEKKARSSPKLSSLLLGSIDEKTAEEMHAELNIMRSEWQRTI